MKNIHKVYLLITFYYVVIKGMVPNNGFPHLDQLFKKIIELTSSQGEIQNQSTRTNDTNWLKNKKKNLICTYGRTV